MSLEELEQEVEARNREAESLVNRLKASANAFEAIHKNMIKEYLKKKLIADIDKETRQVLKDIETNEENLRRNPELFRDVWVHGFRLKSIDRLFLEVESRSLPDSETVKLERIVLAKDFQSRLSSLVSSIEKGSMDHELDMSPREAIWVYVLNVGQK